MPLVDRHLITLLKRKDNGILGEHKILITEEEIVESTSINESHRKWVSIERIDEDDEYIFIATTAWGMYYIPKRDFTSSDVAKQFFNQARSYHENSQTV